MRRRFRIIFGRSDLLDDLGDSIIQNSNSYPEQISGFDHDTLSDVASASAMQSDLHFSAPNPLVLLGSFRGQPGVRAVFFETLGRIPDVALIIGGSPDGRTKAEVERAAESGIAILPVIFTGGAAANSKSTTNPSLKNAISAIQQANRDYPAVAKLLCDALEQQAAISRSR